MDPITHTLTGAALSRAGFNRWCPRAAAVLMLSANAPDLDVVSAFVGPLNYLEYHRHITHTFLLTPLLAALTVAAVAAFRPSRLKLKEQWFPMFCTAVIGVLVHLALDWTNIYGLRPFLPFSGAWHQAGITHLVDIWIWLILALGFIAPFVSGLVSAEIGARNTSGRGAAVLVLALLFGYEAGRYMLASRAVEILGSRLYQGEARARILAVPGPVNPLRWTGIVETSGFFSIQNVNLLSEFDPSAGRFLSKPPPQAALDIARKTETIRRFLEFSQSPYWRVTPVDEPEHGVRIDVMDLRFGQPPTPKFVASVLLDGSGRVLRQGFSFGFAAMY